MVPIREYRLILGQAPMTASAGTGKAEKNRSPGERTSVVESPGIDQFGMPVGDVSFIHVLVIPWCREAVYCVCSGFKS